MDREAFTVLPPLSPRLPPPPPTPAPTRVAPLTVAHKEKSAFVIISELKSNGPVNESQQHSGRTSPFRGRGFREPSPASSRIPVPSGRSAPASPVRKVKTSIQPPIAGGKSAPASPKRVTTRPPQVPKNLNRRNNNNNNAGDKKLQANNKPSTIITSNKPPAQISRKKPTPAVRNKISGKMKPISTAITIGSLGKDRFVKPSPPAAAPRKSIENNGTATNNAVPDAEKKNTDAGAEKKEEPPRTTPKEESNVVTTPKNEKPPESVKSSPPDHVTIVETSPETQQAKVEESKIHQKADSPPQTKPLDPVVPHETKTVIAEVASTPQHHKTTVHVEAHVREIPVHAVNGVAPGQKIATMRVIDELTPVKDDDTAEATLVEWTTKHPKELAQPDIIPNDMNGVEAIEEVKTTVQGPAEVEVEAGNHSVKFRSPEIHPVSPRVKKLGLYRRLKDGMTGGCLKFDALRRRGGGSKVSPTMVAAKLKKEESEKKNKNKKKEEKKKENKKAENNKNAAVTNNATTTKTDNNNKKSNKFSTKMTALTKFSTKKNKDPPPPRLPEAENKSKAKTKIGLLNRLNCLKKKEGRALVKSKPKPKPKLQRSQATSRPAGGNSRWRKIFCLDRACCAKCRRNRGGGALAQLPPPVPIIKKPEFKRSTSVGGNTIPKLDQTLVEHTSAMKAAIPVLPICLAWTCLIINVFLPGIGTVTSGFLCMCFGKPRFSVNDSMRARFGSLSVNFIIGIGQLFTVIFCLVGWGWSIWWGIIMLKLARKNRRIKLAEKAGGITTATPINRNQGDLELGPGQ